MKKLFLQIFSFGIVGALAFLIDYCLLYVFTEFLHVHYLISSVIGFSVSVIFNYLLSVKWVFDVNKKQTYKEFITLWILTPYDYVLEKSDIC